MKTESRSANKSITPGRSQNVTVVQVISQVNKSHVFQWMALGLKKDFQLVFLLLHDRNSSFEEFLVRHGMEVKRIQYRGKKDLISAFVKTFLFFLRRRPEIVHTHLLDAQLVGLSAAWMAGISRRLYTRHTSNFHHVYHPRATWMDRLSNRLAKRIISISQATEKTLIDLEGVPPKKVVRIPHGFDLASFAHVDQGRIELIRNKWKIKSTFPTIGVIARHIEWKGVQYVVPAFQDLLRHYPEAQLVLANADGPLHAAVVKQLATIPSNQAILIPFEEDVQALYHVFDLYIHTPVDPLCEAFGQTYVESLAAGVPSVFTLSGIGSEFIEDKRNALVVAYRDSAEILAAMKMLCADNGLRERLKTRGRESVAQFELKPSIEKIADLYNQLCPGVHVND